MAVTLEEACVQKILMVAFHTENRGIDKVDAGALLVNDTVAHALDGGLTGVGIADDAAFTDVDATCFKLWLHKDDRGSLPTLRRCAERCKYSGKNESRGDERDVHRKEGWGGLAWDKEFALSEESSVGSLAEGDASVVAKLMGDLAISCIDSKDGGGAGLEHAVGEASGRGADVDTSEAAEVDGPVREGAFKLESATTDVFQIRSQKADDRIGLDKGTCFINTLLVNEDATSED